MAFIMDGFKGDSFDHKYTAKEIIKRICMLFKKKERKMIVAMIFLVINTFIGICIPLVLSDIIDKFNETPKEDLVIVFAGGITILGILSWVLDFMQKKCSKEALLEVTCDVQNASFKSSINKDMSFFDENPSAKVISRITGDTESLANVVNLIISFFKDILIFVVLIIIVLFKNSMMTGILVAFIPAIIGVSLGFRKIARTVSAQLFRAIAQVNQAIKECIIGMSVTKNFGKEDYMYKSFLEVNEATYKTNVKQGLVFSGILPIMNLLSSLGTAIIVYFGSMKVLEGSISFGELYLFIQAVALIWTPITSIASFGGQLQEGFAAAERVFSLIDTESKVIQKDNNVINKIRGNIELRNVTLSYDRNENVLEDFSLIIKEGEKIALVGHTGSGKSTIAHLILRFYEFQKGNIYIDNQDIRSLDINSYRKFIGYVGQTPFLFSGTVIENILYGNSEASEKDAIEAANSIGEGAWIDYLSEGLNTNVGERGSKLSLGQRQLVSIARVILKKPSILVLDEATANIDPITEHYIQEALKFVMEGRTSIAIAHRLSTIKSVDRIIVLSHGKILEEGSHEELIKEGNYYEELYNKYFRYQSLEYIKEQNLRLF